MTQRISELLNEAVACLEPAHPDPVAAVVRRRRTAVTAAVLCAGLAAGVTVVSGRVPVDRPHPPAGAASTVLPEPALADGNVVAGALTLPIPAGWQVWSEGNAVECRFDARLVAIDRADQQGCGVAGIQIRPTGDPLPETGRTKVNTVRPPIVHPPAAAPPDRPAADDAFDRRDTSAAVLAVLRALPAGQRVVLVLRYWAGLSEQEIAAQLGCSTGTVKSRASRALTALRQRYPDPVRERLR